MRDTATKPEKATRLGHKVSVKRMAGHPVYRWRATYIKNGQRHSKGFKTRVEADAWKADREKEAEEFGTAADLTGIERSAVIDTRHRIKALGIDLRAVIEQGLSYYLAAAKSCTVSELIAKVIEVRITAGLSDRYVSDLKSRLARFQKSFGDRPVATVSRDEIAEWLTSLPLSLASRNNFHRVLRVLFAEAIEAGYMTENPAAKVKAAKVIEAEAGILTPEEMAALLAAADDRILPAIAISAFAGLRDSEIHALDWTDVDLAGGHIRVRAKNAKSSRNRLVGITDNLRAWLAPLARKQGPVWPANGRKLHEAAREAAGIAEWPSNALRHSFGSYALAHRKDAAVVALELGHRDTGIVFAHYRKIVKPEAPAAFWGIKPETAANVVNIDRRAV